MRTNVKMADPLAMESLPVPEGVTVAVERDSFTVSGSKGAVRRAFQHKMVGMTVEKNMVTIAAKISGRNGKAIMMSLLSHLANCIAGVQKPFQYTLKVCSGHFPISVKIEATQVKITNFLGEKIPRVGQILENVHVQMQGDVITVESPDIEAAGQTAANLEMATRITKRDRRVFQDGIYITEKPE